MRHGQESIGKLLAEGRHKAPLKYIESITLEEFTLGKLMAVLRHVVARDVRACDAHEAQTSG